MLYAKLLRSCLTLCNPMDCSLLGSSVHGILQGRILEWVGMPFSRGSSQPRDWTRIPCLLPWQVGSSPLAPPGKPNAAVAHNIKLCSVCVSEHDWGLCPSKQGRIFDGPSSGERREQEEETEGRRQRAYGKGKRLGSEKGGKQRRGTGCLVMLIMILTVISNINQIYEVPSTLLNAPHGWTHLL